jgi:hypothetical protein
MAKTEKLTITGHEKMDCSDTKIGTIKLQVNPERISFDYGIEMGPDSSGSSGKSLSTAAATSHPLLGNPTYTHPKLQISTIIDATGVLEAPEGIKVGFEKDKMPSVSDFITQLKNVCYNYRESTHGPPWLKCVWGEVLPSNSSKQGELDGIFRGRLSNLTVEYTLFGESGNPVRAEIQMTIDSAISPAALPKGESPDLSHIIEIKFGDNLPALCKNIYGSPEFFLQIAKINNLSSIYAIEPGMKLLFPPLEKASR